jgi:hypothetical protein
MRSRAARLTLSAAAWIALGFAGYFVFDTETQISRRRDLVRAFDHDARETATAIADLRAAQQAYVAAGQGVDFWMPEAAGLQAQVTGSIDSLRASAESSEARASLMEAASTINEFANVDKQARDYIRFGQPLMAGDVVFTEGKATASTAARLVESSRLAEHRAIDAFESGFRRRQAVAIGAAAVFGALVMIVLALAEPSRREDAVEDAGNRVAMTPAAATGELLLRPGTGAGASARTATPSASSRGKAPGSPAGPTPSRPSVPTLRAAADLCTEFNRVNDPAELPKLLEHAARMMDASGLVVWLGSARGGDLRPVLAHGYSDQVLARMATVSRSADNAAGIAYRTGTLQIVVNRPGVSNGAIVAPLLAAEGCIGAFSAETPNGSEAAESVQALASLVAAQLAGILAGSAAVAHPETPVEKVALG